ncbi:hypothetical protein D4104_00035, partial [Streptomyces alfalfae]
GTLYGYLLHGFLAKGSRFWDWFEADWVHRPLGEMALTPAAGAVITLLCAPPVRRAFRFAMEPELKWAFTQDATALSQGRVRKGRAE